MEHFHTVDEVVDLLHKVVKENDLNKRVLLLKQSTKTPDHFL